MMLLHKDIHIRMNCHTRPLLKNIHFQLALKSIFLLENSPEMLLGNTPLPYNFPQMRQYQCCLYAPTVQLAVILLIIIAFPRQYSLAVIFPVEVASAYKVAIMLPAFDVPSPTHKYEF